MNKQKQSEIQELASQPSLIRNICILAHVDHGKTSLADSLISSNKIISSKLAGKLRYLDSRPDEQERCITMKSSSISLTYPLNNENYLINLIDSPGHVDFSSEVASALRVCDGGLLLVDVVEGICAQTFTVMKQSWDEGIKLCLVLNKIDRLFIELKMSAEDAYKHMKHIIEQANSVISRLFYEKRDRNDESETEEAYFFMPERGNVIFASAVDRWAFTLREFAEIYAPKIGLPPKNLCSCLWGSFYYNPKTKKVMKKPFNDTVKPMFVQLILEQLWKVYETIIVNSCSEEKLQVIIKRINVVLSARDISSMNSNPRVTLQSVMSSWMPLDRTVLSAVIRKLPSPLQAQKVKIAVIAPSLSVSCPELYEGVLSLNSTSLVSAFVSKMIPIDPKTQIARNPGDPEHKSTLIALTRVFSGTLTVNQPIYIIENKGEAIECLIENLYMLMGQYLIPINSAAPGTIVGIGGLQSIILKTATLSTQPTCCSFYPICSKSSPIVKVSVQPVHLYDMPSLINGLKLLDRSDSSVDIYMQDNGEHILVACGEVHLQRCIKDLEDTFAKIPISTSEPLVGFRETIEEGGKEFNDITANKRCQVFATAYPIPDQLVGFLEKNAEVIQKVFASGRTANIEEKRSFVSAFREVLNCCEPGLREMISEHMLGFGPKRSGCNILVHMDSPSVLDHETEADIDDSELPSENSSTNTSKVSSCEICIKDTLLVGFNSAANAGPLCLEPLRGVCIVVKAVKFCDGEIKDIYGPFQGQIISATHDVCKAAVLGNSPRLVEGLYECTFTTTQEYIGKLYAVINKRRGKIVEEVLTEGTDLFVCKAYLPVIESFGFAEELRRMTSGLVLPQLVFSHWQTMTEDPFFSRKTAEDFEEFGDQPILDNLPKTFINKIRRRKGMQTDEKLVAHSDKQRTLTKMR